MSVFVTDEEMEKLPEDPAEAFVQLERIARTRLEAEEAGWQGEHPPDRIYRQYMSTVIPAARVYGITELAGWQRPKVDDNTWQTYQEFIIDVDCCTMELRLNNFRRTKEYSVALNAATKVKLAHWLGQIRETVEKLDVSVAKKDRLFKCINALQFEIDRERTAFQSFGALIIEACDDVGEAAKHLEPVVRMLERIGAALGKAKRAENDQSRLPAPREPKRIDGPTKPKKPDRPLDDDLPF